MPRTRLRKPDWLKVKFPVGVNYVRIDRYHRQQGLNSVCRSAACPNQGECWSKGTATFMILGSHCSRHCRFCNISSHPPQPPDPQEARKVATAIAELQLKHAVLTSVTRDDLPDGGAGQFVALIEQLRLQAPDCRIELLIPDLQGDWQALEKIVAAGPEIIGHNIETVPRLYPAVRPEAEYRRSLALLAQISRLAPDIVIKSGLMLGMGETEAEIQRVMSDLREHHCQVLTLGQYLAPTADHYPVQRYVPPDEFEQLARKGKEMGFEHVEAGPLVRSSYHAEEQFSAREG
ncbi:MAG: lipoyl synthase [Deltaproteobacteria bacterium]|nr:lipoyl synthase [Deltaproteobacteria bacterium]